MSDTKQGLGVPSILGGTMVAAMLASGGFALYMSERNDRAIEQLCSEQGGLNLVQRNDNGNDIYETTPKMLTLTELREKGIRWNLRPGFIHSYLRLQRQADGNYGQAELEIVGGPYLSSDITEQVRKPSCHNSLVAKLKSADDIEKALRVRGILYHKQR